MHSSDSLLSIKMTGASFLVVNFICCYVMVAYAMVAMQGYKCQACKMSIHKRCVHYIRHVCEGHPVS